MNLTVWESLSRLRTPVKVRVAGRAHGPGQLVTALVTALVTLHTPDRRRLTRASATIHARIVPETPMVRPGPFAGTHLHAAGPSPPVGVQRDRGRPVHRKRSS